HGLEHGPYRSFRPGLADGGSTRGVRVPTLSLPDDPTVAHLRRQARQRRRALRAGDPEAAALVGRYDFAAGPDFPLSAAQLLVARECRFSPSPAPRTALYT